MAKLMQFTDQYGNTHAQSYWRVVQVNMSIPEKSALVIFYGYKDKEARDAGKLPVGAKQYGIMGEAFDTKYKEHLEPGGPNIAALAYEVATSTIDTPTPDDPKAFQSFFAGAKDV